MTSLSIPERAREIAEKIDRFIIDFRDLSEDETNPAPEQVLKGFAHIIAEALESEREQCAKELEAAMPSRNGTGKFSGKDTTLRNAAKLLREGGQK